jgi:hypothetical protein
VAPGSPFKAGRYPTSVAKAEAGLFYAYNVRRGTAKGRVVFEPTAKLLARF